MKNDLVDMFSSSGIMEKVQQVATEEQSQQKLNNCLNSVFSKGDIKILTEKVQELMESKDIYNITEDDITNIMQEVIGNGKLAEKIAKDEKQLNDQLQLFREAFGKETTDKLIEVSERIARKYIIQ